MNISKLNNLGMPEVSQELMLNEGNWTKVDSDLFPELTDHFKWIRRNVHPRKLYSDPKVAKGFKDIIFKNTGINIEIGTNYHDFGVIPPDINSNSILIKPKNKHYYTNEEIRKRSGEIRGFIDLKNFRVSGDFSLMKSTLYISPELIYGDFYKASNEELAAAVCHEIGHVFSYFALAAYTYSAVMPMIGMVNRVLKTNNTEELTVVLKEWNDEPTNLTTVDVKELSSKNKEVIVTAIVGNYTRDFKSIMRHNSYEQINAEYLADKFAARVGAGVYVVSMLDKIYSAHGTRAKMSLNQFIFNEFVISIPLVLGFALGMIVGFGVLASAIFSAVNYISSLIAVGHTNLSDGTYDTELNRYRRIREDLVSMLKDKKIDTAIGARIRTDIKQIDNILKDYNEYKSVVATVLDYIIPSRRRIGIQTEYYRELEKLGNNDLFVSAYDLKQL